MAAAGRPNDPMTKPSYAVEDITVVVPDAEQTYTHNLIVEKQIAGELSLYSFSSKVFPFWGKSGKSCSS